MEEKELFGRYKKLYTALISDSLDKIGYTNQSMDYRIRPLVDNCVIVGRALTMLSIRTYRIPEKPYEKEMEALDKINPGEVIVATTNGEYICGFWGELLSQAAIARGSNGAIIDGLTRDAGKIMKMGFPVFTRGFSPNDSKGRSLVVDYNCEIECGGVRVKPGDLVFADFEGIVVVPKGLEEDVLLAAEDKFYGENTVREELASGKSVVEVFEKYGIL